MINPGGTTQEERQRNWDNFCRYHALGDWCGIWTVYSPQGKVIDSFKCTRSLRVSQDSREIYHQNSYLYSDGKTEIHNFGPYNKNTARALYLENSFSWGTTTVKPGSSFFFETGFSSADRRASVVVMYDESGALQQIIAIREHFASFDDTPSRHVGNERSGNWQGILKSMTPDLKNFSLEATEWKRLEDLREGYLTYNFLDGISISCPLQIEYGKSFFGAVDWLVNSALLYRGIRYFDLDDFATFTLQIFTLISKI